MMRKLLLCALLAAPAVGDEVDNVLAVWDLNRDGTLTPDEVPDAAIFGKVDADKDGKVTREEIALFLKVKPEPKKDGKGPEGKEGKDAKGAKPEEKKSESAPEVEPRTIKERVDDLFRRYDQDKDGKIQRKELPGASDEQWQRYDRTRDEALNRREATRYVEEQLEMAKRAPRPDNFMDLFDMNRDKKVTKKEYDGPGQFFRQYDTDKDDVITEAELAAPPMVTMRPEDEMDVDGPTALPKQGLLERYDANKDDRVTADELKAENIFRRLDKNGDGILTGPELR
jgi:Ca2+-binding EF-hand superfamily protein